MSNAILNNTTKALQSWNKEFFGYTHTRIKALEEELVFFQQKEEFQEKPSARHGEIIEELRTQRERQEKIFKQKSREVWLQEGDRNTKFFHASIVIQRRRNRILSINDNSVWLHSAEEIGNYFRREFNELFSSSIPRLPSNLREFIAPCITADENDTLMAIPTSEEIKDAVWNLHPLKSPGSNGYLGIFL